MSRDFAPFEGRTTRLARRCPGPLRRHAIAILHEGSTQCQGWDIENLDSWPSCPDKVRVVRSIETTRIHERGAGRRIERLRTSEWIWVTTLPAAEAPTESIVHWGHERWRIENEAFNELCNRRHADRSFRHHPVSILALWLLLFIAHGLFHCFMRNLKPCIRRGHSALFWADLMRAELLLPVFSSA